MKAHLQPQTGFTLIELMIVVVVIGILAAFAYPAYTDSLRKARRTDAQAALVGMAAAMERFMVSNGGSYANATGGAALPAAATFYPAQVPLEGGRATYQLRITALSAGDYTLSAIPVNVQTGDGCGTLTLNASGQQGRSGSLDLPDCWRN